MLKATPMPDRTTISPIPGLVSTESMAPYLGTDSNQTLAIWSFSYQFHWAWSTSSVKAIVITHDLIKEDVWATDSEHARLLVVKVTNRPPAASWSWQKLGFLPSHDNRSCQPWSVEFKIIYPRNFYIIFCTCSQFNMFYSPFALLSYSSCQDSDRCPHSSPPPGAGSAVASEDFEGWLKRDNSRV